MNILVTGATGLIGSAVGQKLVRQGHTVRVLVRHPEAALASLAFPCEVFQWDDYTAEIPPESLRDVEGIIHLAGDPIAEGRWSAQKKQRIRDSRIIGTANLVKAILASPLKLKVFVLGSAMGYYGDCGDTWIHEEAKPGHDFLASVTVDWEKALEPLRAREGLRLVQVRTSMVLDKNKGALALMLPVFQKGFGGALGSGQQFMSWIHIDDIASLFVFAVENAKVNGPINGAAPEPVRNQEFTQELARILKRSAVLSVPKLALKVVLGEFADSVLMSQRLSAEKLLKLGFQFRYPKLLEALGDLCAKMQNGTHELVFEQWLNRPVKEIFTLFADEKNLEELTPKFIGFHVLGKSTEQIGEGTLIDYRMKIHGVPIKWQSRIEEWAPGRRFVDTQTKGPYQYWHHTHEFEILGQGTLIRDRVLYRVPMGRVGEMVAGGKVFGDVAKIFAYRRKRIQELFPRQ